MTIMYDERAAELRRQQEEEQAQLQRDHELKVKQLEVEAQSQRTKIETRWDSFHQIVWEFLSAPATFIAVICITILTLAGKKAPALERFLEP